MSLKALRIVWRVTALNFRAQMEYRTEFLLMIAIGAIWQVSVIVFATVLLSRFAGMGGWDSSDVLLIPATRMLAHEQSVRAVPGADALGRPAGPGGPYRHLSDAADAGAPPDPAGVLPDQRDRGPDGGGGPDGGCALPQ
jgi:hypothetical protein